MTFESEDGKKHSLDDTSGMPCRRCGAWVYNGMLHFCKDLIGPQVSPRETKVTFESAAEAQFWMKVVESAAAGSRSVSVSIEMADIAVKMLRERVPAEWRPKATSEPSEEDTGTQTMGAKG